MDEVAIKLNDDISSEIEWRLDELDLFTRPLRHSIFTPAEENIYYKSLLVMLYAHFEGYCKFCFLAYAGSLNELKLKIDDVSPQIAIHNLNKFFDQLENTDRTNNKLNSDNYDNAPVQKLWRRIDFCENTKHRLNYELKINDKEISTKSNLNVPVMRLLLYKLGFQLDIFNQHNASINKLVNYRNLIAHGGKPSKEDFKKAYEDIRVDIFKVMENLQKLLVNGIKNKEYLDRKNNS